MTGFWRPPYATDFQIARGSGGGGSQTSTSQVIVPQWVQEAGQKNLSLADQIAGQGFEANPYNIVAPLSADQTAAYDTVRGVQGAAAPGYQAAEAQVGGLLGQAKPITAEAIGSNVSSLMRPYSDIVIDPSLELMRQELARTKQGIGAKAGSVGAFGGSRQGVEEGIADSQTALQAGQLKSGLLQSGLSAVLPVASGIETQNQALGQWANTTLPALYGAESNQRIKDAAALEQAGLAQRGYSQEIINSQAAEEEMRKTYPIEMLQLREQALSAVPYGNQTSSTGPGPQSNTAGMIIGGAGAAASVALAAVAI